MISTRTRPAVTFALPTAQLAPVVTAQPPAPVVDSMAPSSNNAGTLDIGGLAAMAGGLLILGMSAAGVNAIPVAAQVGIGILSLVAGAAITVPHRSDR